MEHTLHVVHTTLADLERFVAEQEESEDDLKVVLGEMYADEVTGFVGVATSICFNLHSETVIHLENNTTSRWIEEKRLEVAS